LRQLRVRGNRVTGSQSVKLVSDCAKSIVYDFRGGPRSIDTGAGKRGLCELLPLPFEKVAGSVAADFAFCISQRIGTSLLTG
jgi:hypothetical protein